MLEYFLPSASFYRAVAIEAASCGLYDHEERTFCRGSQAEGGREATRPKDKIVVTGETWCGTIAGEVKQVAGFIDDVADQAIADTTTVQSYAKAIRQAVRSFTIPAGVPGVDAQRPALDRLRAAAQQTLDRLDALLAELATGRAQLQQELNKVPTLDCTKLGPALELSGRIFDLRRRAILEVRNLAQHLVDIDALVANLVNAAPVVGVSSPPGSLKIELTQAVSDVGDALRGLIRSVTSIGTIEATPAPGSIWDRVKQKIDAIRNDSNVAAMQHYVDELGGATQQLHDIGLALKASAESNGLAPAKILDLARQASGFSVDQERRLAALVLQIVVADNQLAGAIATGIDSVLMAIGTVLFPIHDVADTAVKAVIDIITLPNPPDPTKPSYILSVLIRDDVRQKIAKGEVELSYDLGQIKILRDGGQGARIGAAQALRSKLSLRPLGLVLATGPLLQVVEAVFKSHISDIFNFSALQPLLRQAIEQLLPTRIDLAYDFNTDIGSFPPGDPILEMESSTDQDLVLKSRVTIDLFDPVGGRKVAVDGALRPFNVKLLGTAPDLATIKFKGATFSAGTGKAFSFKAPIDNVEIGSALAFIQALASWLSPGEGNGPYFFVSPDPPGVVAGFRFDAGLITLGEMQFLNIAFDVSGLLPFDDRAAEFRFGLASPDCPFLIVFVPYGGGGYVGLVATAKGIQQIAASFECGAVVAVNFAVLTGQGRVSTGIYIEQDVGAGGVIAGFVHAAGEGHIACFGVSINIEVRIEQHTGGGHSECTGSASYRFKFSLGLCDVSYSFTATYAVQGSGGGSTRAERAATRYAALRVNRASEPSYQRPVDFCSNVPEKSHHWRQYRRRIALDALRA